MLEVSALTGGYGSKTVLNDISFFADKADMIYVLGANGCGKTTLLNMLTGFKNFTGGSITVSGTSINDLSIQERSKLVSYIPQQHVPAFNYTVKDVVLMGRAGRLRYYQTPGEEDINIAEQALSLLGIEDFSQKEYTQLSGGERQLVLIARAICQQAEIVIMDEPMQSLDFINQAMVLRAARLLTNSGRCVIMSTHTAINNYQNSDKMLLMSKDGTALSGEIEEVLTQENVRNAYGTNLQIMRNTDEKGGRHITCLPLSI